MKVLVTGGAGFIGSHIVDECLKAGHEVVILDNLRSGARAVINPNAKLHKASVTDRIVQDIVAEERVEAIIHSAAQVGVPSSINNPLNDADINILGTINLLQAARANGVKRFIFSSSAAVYGNPDYLPIDEEHPLRPLSFYALSKKTDEEYIRMFGELFGLNYMIFRFANVYGPRQGDGEKSVIPLFMNQMLRGETITIDGDGGAVRDFLYVGDVARANVAALTSDAVGTFNLSTQTEVTVNEVAEALARLTGYEKEPVHGPARFGDIYKSILKNERVLAALPWKPETSLEDGMKATIAWGREQIGRDR